MNFYCYWCGQPLVESTTKPKVVGEFVYECPTPDCDTKIETEEPLDIEE